MQIRVQRGERSSNSAGSIQNPASSTQHVLITHACFPSLLNRRETQGLTRRTGHKVTVSRGSAPGAGSPCRRLALSQPFCRDVPPQQRGNSLPPLSEAEVGVCRPQETQKWLLKLFSPSLSFGIVLVVQQNWFYPFRRVQTSKKQQLL